MKHEPVYRLLLLGAALLVLGICPVVAQDIIYAQGSTKDGKVTEITSDKVIFNTTGKKAKAMFLPRGKVSAAFNSTGHFLVFTNLPGDTSQEHMLINDFLNNSALPSQDKLITLQSQVIDGKIDKEDKKEISYTTASGTKGQVKKATLAVIIYRNGSHKMLESEKKVIGPLAAAQSLNLNALVAGSNQAKNTADSTAAATAAAAAAQKADEDAKAAAQKAKADAAQVSPAPTVDSSSMANQHISELGDVSFAEYEQKALDKTQDLKKYLALLTDKRVDWVEANKAIDQAVDLFVSEEAIVETSSINNQTVTRFKIRDYLKRIKLIQYDKVEIEWANVHYVSKLRKGPDGNYYGTITFEQTFRGYIENKLVYGDVTRKNVEVILKTYNRNVEGKSVPTWDVFLSQIKVVTTKSA
jgi:hypothetical protein